MQLYSLQDHIGMVCVLCSRGHDHAPLHTDDEPGAVSVHLSSTAVSPTEGTKHGKDLGPFRGFTMETLRNVD